MSNNPNKQNSHPMTFLKLGGSLITDKTTPSTPCLDVLARLAEEIASARAQNPEGTLILGHGSGSFGHVPAEKYATRKGVTSSEEWHGFVEVWMQASELNRLVIQALHQAGVSAISFPASASVVVSNGEINSWDLEPLKTAIQSGLVPVVYGDVAFDTERGGTILSTEDIFRHLAIEFKPGRILLAGLEGGVWADYPQRSQFVSKITRDTLETLVPVLGSSAATDVTGGMASKVQEMLELIDEMPNIEVQIFSGTQPENVLMALSGEILGTLLTT